MDTFNQLEHHHGSVTGQDDFVELPFERREKARQRVCLNTGEEVGIQIQRGSVMRGGDLLYSEKGRVIRVKAAAEAVSTVTSTDPAQLARVAYHLGNRHVWLQIGDGWVRYLADHVLDEMVRGLGAVVTCEQAPFEPESGAYGHSHD
ncbi:MAG: urease accessory protein UreE [Pseudomonadota bacterium]